MNDGGAGRLTRRGFLAGTTAAALAACSDGDGSSPSPSSTTIPLSTTTTAAPSVTSDPFAPGVASGDPLDDSVILWTRLLPSDPLPDEDVEVEWEVATDAEREAFLARRAAGYQAWYEHMPVRLDPPSGSDYDIYRSFAHGDLVRFHVLDERQYRADQQREAPLVEVLGDDVQYRDAALGFSSEQTMLGDAQREWLFESVASSTAIWDVLAQHVFMFGGNAVVGADPPAVVVDTWDGYAGERQAALTANPQIKWFDARRGYTVCDVTPERWLANYRAVEDEFDEASPVADATRWEVVAGTRGSSSSP